MSSFERRDAIVLALMLVYLFAVVIHVSCRYYLARRAQGVASASKRKLAAVLNIEVGILKSIALTAPYLGLVGTCEGILSAFGTGAMAKHAFLAMITTRISLALIPTAVGISVAILATCSHNYLRTRIDLLTGEVFDEGQQRGRHFRGSHRFPPTKRFSELPAFGLIAAPVLAIAIMGCMTFPSFHAPTGFYVEIAPARCEYDGDDRLILLHITDAGKLFLNQEQADWNTLPGRLSEIYRMRKHRTLYLLADYDVPFRTVAHALDAVESDPAMVGPQAGGTRMDRLNINIRLVTPTTLKAGCPKPIVTASGHYVLR